MSTDQSLPAYGRPDTARRAGNSSRVSRLRNAEDRSRIFDEAVETWLARCPEKSAWRDKAITPGDVRQVLEGLGEDDNEPNRALISAAFERAKTTMIAAADFEAPCTVEVVSGGHAWEFKINRLTRRKIEEQVSNEKPVSFAANDGDRAVFPLHAIAGIVFHEGKK